MSFLPFFVIPYPDENFHSIIARYHMYAGNISRNHTYKELFGTEPKAINYKSPSYLGILSSKVLSEKITTKMLIDEHTLISFFSSFNPQKGRVAKKAMMDPHREEKNHFVSPNRPLWISETLQHCSTCMEEDYQKYGTTYWHRMHQLPGVFVCPLHNIPLLTVKKELMNNRDVNFILATESNIFDSNPISVPEEINKEMLIRYAKQAKRLLDSKICYEPENINAIYQNALKVKGYYNGKLLNRIRCYQDVKDFYGVEFLNMFSSPLVNEKRNWLYNALYNEVNTLPAHHILVMIFLLGREDENLSDKMQKYKINQLLEKYPFGNGPWPCLNPVHSDYEKDVIETVRISRYKNVKIGTFRCECGFEYSKKISYLKNGNEYGVPRVINYGYLWKKRLNELVKQGKSLPFIAKELGVPATTIRYQRSMNDFKTTRTSTNMEKDREKKYKLAKGKIQKKLNKRSEWLKLIEQNATVTPYTDKALHRWLRKNDREWFLQHSPVQELKRNIFDWEKKDEEVLQEVKNIVDKWKDIESVYPQKISKHSIARQSKSYNAIIKSEKKMKKTSLYLNTVIETSEQYHLRKLEWAYKELKNNGVRITRTSLKVKAGIGVELSNKYWESTINK